VAPRGGGMVGSTCSSDAPLGRERAREEGRRARSAKELEERQSSGIHRRSSRLEKPRRPCPRKPCGAPSRLRAARESWRELEEGRGVCGRRCSSAARRARQRLRIVRHVEEGGRGEAGRGAAAVREVKQRKQQTCSGATSSDLLQGRGR
jgi:hypothetical protein